jgi:hypothetical protein
MRLPFFNPEHRTFTSVPEKNHDGDRRHAACPFQHWELNQSAWAETHKTPNGSTRSTAPVSTEPTVTEDLLAHQALRLRERAPKKSVSSLDR